MRNKIIVLVICLIILASCGRKGDPEFKSAMHNIIMHKVQWNI
tara:strand:+ start:57 stop:185 length:129 start_codon:yes stop_codon:yes gene_type:complete